MSANLSNCRHCGTTISGWVATGGSSRAGPVSRQTADTMGDGDRSAVLGTRRVAQVLARRILVLA